MTELTVSQVALEVKNLPASAGDAGDAGDRRRRQTQETDAGDRRRRQTQETDAGDRRRRRRRRRRCRVRFDPWDRKIPWSRKWQPTPVFLPGESHGQRSWVGYSPQESQRVGHD